MIDEIDRKILNLIQKNCRFSVADIGEHVGLSTSACHRRIGILEDKGVILDYAARLSGEKLGYKMTFYVEVSLENQSEAALNAFEKAALARPEVLECYLTTGSADYLIKVAAPNPYVNRIQSSLVMKTVKRWAGYPTQLLYED